MIASFQPVKTSNRCFIQVSDHRRLSFTVIIIFACLIVWQIQFISIRERFGCSVLTNSQNKQPRQVSVTITVVGGFAFVGISADPSWPWGAAGNYISCCSRQELLSIDRSRQWLSKFPKLTAVQSAQPTTVSLAGLRRSFWLWLGFFIHSLRCSTDTEPSGTYFLCWGPSRRLLMGWCDQPASVVGSFDFMLIVFACISSFHKTHWLLAALMATGEAVRYKKGESPAR